MKAFLYIAFMLPTGGDLEPIAFLETDSMEDCSGVMTTFQTTQPHIVSNMLGNGSAVFLRCVPEDEVD